MNKKDEFDKLSAYWIEKLQQEGFTDVRVVTILPGEDPLHTHDFDTINVLLDGEITIIDRQGSRTYRAEDRMETPAGTTHRAINGPGVGRMVVGVRKKEK